MTKKDLVTLAEVAQLEIHPHSSYLWVRRYTSNGEDYNLEIWQPHLDIKQAMEVLDSIDHAEEIFRQIYSSFKPKIAWSVTVIDSKGNLIARGEGETRVEAICQAVLKAVEVERRMKHPCDKCGNEMKIKVDPNGISMTYASIPPKYDWICPKCKFTKVGPR